jgi:tRNA-uridine 2-sulfurtransferase
MAPSKTSVIVGLSGGVDSAVAALLLKEQGYNVTAVFMQNWQDTNDDHCTYAQDLADAQAVASQLQIPFMTVNFAAEYWQKVFQLFLDEYAACRTPNPDILCNKEIKFKAFLDYAKEHGANYIATGHYARNHCIEAKQHLLKATDKQKDQSYFLHLLNQQQLAASIFPLGEITKTEVRAIAKKNGFCNYAKKDSTGICFIGERKFKKFLSEYLLNKPGDIVVVNDDKITVIGKHDGLMFYTIGQRQGLQIGGKKNAQEAPWYVAVKDLTHNHLIVTQDKHHPALSAQKLVCNKLHWIAGDAPNFNRSFTAKIRYRQNDQICQLDKNTVDTLTVTFEEPQWAITPGQAVVFYDGDECLGGGTIINAVESFCLS